jgi:hypothetical protein
MNKLKKSLSVLAENSQLLHDRLNPQAQADLPHPVQPLVVWLQ